MMICPRVITRPTHAVNRPAGHGIFSHLFPKAAIAPRRESATCCHQFAISLS